MMTMNAAARAIAKALDAIHSAYWAVGDAERRAIDPDALGAPDGLLDVAYEAALTVESIAAERELSWDDARKLV